MAASPATNEFLRRNSPSYLSRNSDNLSSDSEDYGWYLFFVFSLSLFFFLPSPYENLRSHFLNGDPEGILKTSLHIARVKAGKLYGEGTAGRLASRWALQDEILAGFTFIFRLSLDLSNFEILG